MGVFLDFARKIFKQEEENAIAWFRRKKVFFLFLLVLFLAVYAYFQWPAQAQAIISALNRYILWVIIFWLGFLTFYLYLKDREPRERVFRENFKHGLQRWEYFGEWKVEEEDAQHVLIVRKSDLGGFALPCRQWIDYTFEFETKIVQAATSWIIRASDIHNYVLLQCTPTKINPHYRVNGQWIRLEPVHLETSLPVNKWFKVHVKVKGTRVCVRVALEGQDSVLLDSYLLEPQALQAEFLFGDTSQKLNLFASFPVGSIGFRQYGASECAHFKNVRVIKL